MVATVSRPGWTEGTGRDVGRGLLPIALPARCSLGCGAMLPSRRSRLSCNASRSLNVFACGSLPKINMQSGGILAPPWRGCHNGSHLSEGNVNPSRARLPREQRRR